MKIETSMMIPVIHAKIFRTSARGYCSISLTWQAASARCADLRLSSMRSSRPRRRRSWKRLPRCCGSAASQPGVPRHHHERLAGSSGPTAASNFAVAEHRLPLRLQSPIAWAMANDDEWLTAELGRWRTLGWRGFDFAGGSREDLAGVYGEEQRRGRGSCHESKKGVVPRGIKRHDAEPRAWCRRSDDGDVHPDAIDPVRVDPRRRRVAHGGVFWRQRRSGCGESVNV
jgi:hypothetical protein